jgi:hypothetical protein
VVGVGEDVVVDQIDPSTLSVHATESLPVRDGKTSVNPVLTATVSGPLWVAGDKDLWALNPNTGAVESEFNTGDEIASMSTDPSGSLFYTGGEVNADGEWSVKEYDAQTGRELMHTAGIAVGTARVAATTGGVWVSLRSGMAGGAAELSATGLTRIAPPASESRGFGTFDAMGGVESGVSEKTLWLAQITSLTCADPRTGAIRASEPTPMDIIAPVASGNLLYAFASSGGVSGSVVVITPPAKCFG